MFTSRKQSRELEREEMRERIRQKRLEQERLRRKEKDDKKQGLSNEADDDNCEGANRRRDALRDSGCNRNRLKVVKLRKSKVEMEVSDVPVWMHASQQHKVRRRAALSPAVGEGGSLEKSLITARRIESKEKVAEQRQEEIIDWMNGILKGEAELKQGEDLGGQLKDGTILCRLVNKLREVAGSSAHEIKLPIPFHRNPRFPLKMMENIYFFLSACQKIFPKSHEVLFEPLDLFEKKNISKVFTTLLELRAAVNNPRASLVEKVEKRLEQLIHHEGEAVKAIMASRRASLPPTPTTSSDAAPVYTPPSVAASRPSVVPSIDTFSLSSRTEFPTTKTVHTKEQPLTLLEKLKLESSRGGYDEDDFDNEDEDDDWETSADYQCSKIMAIVPLPKATMKPEVVDPKSYVFGVKRGACEKKNCTCTEYRSPNEKDSTQGGKCNNCGHYPTKHKELDRMAQFNTSSAMRIIPRSAIQLYYQIGRGSFGTVYRAELWGQIVAVKELQQESITPKILDEFQAEAEILSSLRHPNVVLFMGAVMEGKLCLITEMLSRGSLEDVILAYTSKDGTFNLDWAKRIDFAIDACHGMAYLHQVGLIHRDLKTKNLLVHANWTVKIADFGLSIPGEVAATLLGGPAGTPGYLAPEVLLGNPPTPAADIWAMGIILWELLTGEPPWTGYSGETSLNADIRNGGRPRIPPWCPDKYRKLMEKCWHADPLVRPSFTKIALALAKIPLAIVPSDRRCVVRSTKVGAGSARW